MVTTAIFDMDGLLIDSEPFWEEAGIEVLKEYGIGITSEEYYTTTGLRTKEWVAYWFGLHGITADPVRAEEVTVSRAIEKIAAKAIPLPGVEYILNYFKDRGMKIGLATSSPHALIEVVMDKLNIRNYFQAVSSAEYLPYGKPHPQVFMNCAEMLGVPATECVCFEDSFNGMIAAKACRMKCVIIPAPIQRNEHYWSAADIKLTSLNNFNDLLLERLQ